MTAAERSQTGLTLWEGWRWSKGQPIGNFGSIYSRNAFLRRAAYPGGFRDNPPCQ